jgi:hypothetical protein
MSNYRDPYANPTYGSYNPYEEQQPHRTYDPAGYDPYNNTGGYRDEPFQPPVAGGHSPDRTPYSDTSKEVVAGGFSSSANKPLDRYLARLD